MTETEVDESRGPVSGWRLDGLRMLAASRDRDSREWRASSTRRRDPKSRKGVPRRLGSLLFLLNSLELKMKVSRGGCSCQSGLDVWLKGRESRLVLRTGSEMKQKEKGKKRVVQICARKEKVTMEK